MQVGVWGGGPSYICADPSAHPSHTLTFILTLTLALIRTLTLIFTQILTLTLAFTLPTPTPPSYQYMHTDPSMGWGVGNRFKSVCGCIGVWVLGGWVEGGLCKMQCMPAWGAV